MLDAKLAKYGTGHMLVAMIQIQQKHVELLLVFVCQQCNAMSAAVTLACFKVIYHWGLSVLWGLAPVPKLLKKRIGMQARTVLLLLPQHVADGVFCAGPPAADNCCVLHLVRCGLRHGCSWMYNDHSLFDC